ncbi:MAG: hypothetical protein ABL994_15650 [Verrucomicrobiales bacterium]
MPLEFLGIAADRDKLAGKTLPERWVGEGPTGPLSIVSGAPVRISHHDPEKNRSILLLGNLPGLYQVGAPSYSTPSLLGFIGKHQGEAIIETLSPDPNRKDQGDEPT